MTDGSCGSELTGGVAIVEIVVEALVLALPGRGSVEVVIKSAEEVSASEDVTAEAAGCVNCGSRDSSPPSPPASSRLPLSSSTVTKQRKKRWVLLGVGVFAMGTFSLPFWLAHRNRNQPDYYLNSDR